MTPNKEDYLKCIYTLNQQYHKVNNKMIAENMAVSAPAVSGMVKKLIDEYYLLKDKDTGYRVTEKGIKLVSTLIRKHRLIEVFLIEELGYEIEDVHIEAEEMEHAVSDYFIERLESYLKYPKACPHGGKIPKKDEILIENFESLCNVEEGIYKVVRLLDYGQLLTFLKKYRIEVGSTIHLIEHNTFAQMSIVKINGKTHSFSDVVCRQILVERV